jgi:anti-repressor protein
MNDIKIFESKQFGKIRTAGTNDNPLFCLTDVCKALSLDSSQVIKRLNDGVVTIHPIQDNLGRTQQANFVNEDGLYDVILDSRKLEAKAFRKWITSKVLPSIRKTGQYNIASYHAASYQIEDPIKRAEKWIEEEKERQRLLLENQQKEQLLIEQEPKVNFADAMITSTTSCLVGELAKIITQNGYEIGQNRLFKWLRDNG